MKPPHWPFWSIWRLSLAKVEKVVNPPHKPVVRSRHQGCEVEQNRLNKAKITPIRKHPTRLTINVPHGKLCEQAFFIQVEMRYLNAPPTKLPRPTKHSDFIIIQLFSFFLRYKVSKKTCNYLDVTKNVGSIHPLCSRDPSPFGRLDDTLR